MTVKELSAEDFEEKTSEGTWVIDFWASWCGPCKKMKPVFKEASEEMDDVNFGSVNIEDNQELAGKYSVRSIPNFVKIVDGEVQGQQMGVMKKEDLKGWAEK